MWRSLGAVMGEDAHVVIRIGSRKISPEPSSAALLVVLNSLVVNLKPSAIA